MSLKKKLLVTLLAGTMCVSAFAGCGGQEAPAQEAVSEAADEEAKETPEAAEETDAAAEESDAADAAEEEESAEVEEISATWLLAQGVNTAYYDEYEDNPIVKDWLSKTWKADGRAAHLTIDFITPPVGAEKDNFNTLMATNELPEIFSTAYCSETPGQLYEEGMILDLTDYVDKYLPHYVEWMDEHPDYASQMTINGKHLTIYDVADGPHSPWDGYVYRRDWIVRYGKNPETGESFTGEWNADHTEWSDDVVFPSGGSDPIYISDWEWMFDIFETAMKEQGIDDGYAFQIYYLGYLQTGDLISGFGGGGPLVYLEDGRATYGAAGDNFRAYLDCMHTWYEKGWLNQNFEENSGDRMFTAVDTAKVYSGKVGMWLGYTNQIGSSLDTGDEYTKDMCVYGARQPINDIYGGAEQQNKEPNLYFQNSMVGAGICVNSSIDQDKLPLILTAIDYLYTYEGGVHRMYGFSDKEMAEIQDPFYLEYGMEDGGYTVKTDEDGNDVIYVNTLREAADDLAVALLNLRVPGLTVNTHVNRGFTETQQHGYDEAVAYPASAAVSSIVTAQLSPDVSSEGALIQTNLTTFLSQAVPDFIVGRRDIDSDDDWKTYCDEVESFGYQSYVDAINEVLEK